MFKQLFISLIFVLGLYSLSSAQFVDRRGITISGTYSNLISSDPGIMKRDYAKGYGAGFFLESDIATNLSVITNVEFSSRRYNYTTPSEDQSATHTLYHISVPILSKLRGTGFLSQFYGKIGPRFDYFLDSNDEMILTCSGWECGQIEDEEVMLNSKRLVPGWSAALGREFSILGNNISIELRYNDDFGTINQDESSEPIQKRAIDIWLGFPISL